MRILVTGGTGFLGGYMLPMLADHEVFAISRGSHKNKSFPDNVSWIEADLSNGLDPALLPEKMDGIIHLAQSDDYRSNLEGASDMFRVNVELPATLLRWAEKAGVQKFVSASTGTVYEPFDNVMREDLALSPGSYYGASKYAAEVLAAPYKDAFSVAQMRVFFLYGPGQEGMMIANIINAIKQGNELTLPEDNDGLEFAPTYVEDTARGFVKALEEGWQGAYNIAAPHRVSFKQLLDEIGQAVGKEVNVKRIEAPKPTPIVPDLDKIRTKMNVDDFITLREGLAKIVAAG